MGINQSNILTMSAEAYIDKKASRTDFGYYFVGVHVNKRFSDNAVASALEEFAKAVPDNAEVVADFRTSTSVAHSYYYVQMSGTALVPKKDQK